MTRAVYSPSFFATVAIGLSVGVHVLVLAIRFVPPMLDDLRNHDQIEVVLVNSKSVSKPLKDYKLAQADLDGGGNTAQNRSLSSPLPSAKENNDNQLLEETQQRKIEELVQQRQQLMTQLRDKSDLSTADALSPQVEEVSPNLNAKELVQNDIKKEMQLQAQINKDWSNYQKMPRKSFIGARTHSAVEALYVDAFLSKVERIGEQFYPAELSRRKLYGRVLVTVEIDKTGKLIHVEISKSSNSKMLDEAALGLLYLSAPFGKFSKQLADATDVLVISRHITFTSSDQVAVEATLTD